MGIEFSLEAQLASYRLRAERLQGKVGQQRPRLEGRLGDPS